MIVQINGQKTFNTNHTFLERNFLHAYGVFTTIRIQNHAIQWFDEHWQRLLLHVSCINLSMPVNKQRCLHNIKQLLKTTILLYPQCHTFKLRIIITAGQLHADMAAKSSQSNWYLMIEPLKLKKSIPWTLTVHHDAINEKSALCHIKQCNYLQAILAKQHARANGYDDALQHNTQGYVVGGTTFNVFFIRNNQLHTPCVDSGALAGIVREKNNTSSDRAWYFMLTKPNFLTRNI